MEILINAIGTARQSYRTNLFYLITLMRYVSFLLSAIFSKTMVVFFRHKLLKSSQYNLFPNKSSFLFCWTNYVLGVSHYVLYSDLLSKCNVIQGSILWHNILPIQCIKKLWTGVRSRWKRHWCIQLKITTPPTFPALFTLSA